MKTQVALIKATVKLTMTYKRNQLGNLKDEDVGKLLETFAKVHLDKIYPSRRTRLYVTTLGYDKHHNLHQHHPDHPLNCYHHCNEIFAGRYEDPSIISYFYLVRDEDESVMVKASQVNKKQMQQTNNQPNNKQQTNK